MKFFIQTGKITKSNVARIFLMPRAPVTCTREADGITNLESRLAWFGCAGWPLLPMHFHEHNFDANSLQVSC